MPEAYRVAAVAETNSQQIISEIGKVQILCSGPEVRDDTTRQTWCVTGVLCAPLLDILSTL